MLKAVFWVCGARNGVYSYLFILTKTIICHSVQELGIRIQAEWCIKAITALRGDSDVWKAMDYVRIMVANDLSPDDAVISKLVSSFSRVGQAVKATDLVRWAQVKPLTFRTTLFACNLNVHKWYMVHTHDERLL